MKDDRNKVVNLSRGGLDSNNELPLLPREGYDGQVIISPNAYFIIVVDSSYSDWKSLGMSWRRTMPERHFIAITTLTTMEILPWKDWGLINMPIKECKIHMKHIRLDINHSIINNITKC